MEPLDTLGGGGGNLRGVRGISVQRDVDNMYIASKFESSLFVLMASGLCWSVRKDNLGG